MASCVSNAFTSGVFAPSGKPMTVQTLTPLPSNRRLACSMLQGLMQTDAAPIPSASRQICSTCAGVAVALRIVWSIILANCFLFISGPPWPCFG